MNKTDYAVVVGISKYRSIKPELSGPEIDAQAFYAWLISAAGGNLPKENVSRIVSSDYVGKNASLQADSYDYAPTLREITGAFAKLFSLTVRNSGKVPRVGRRLYIYLSGHGITPRSDPTASINNSGLLMANCEEDVLYDYVCGQANAEWFRMSHAFSEILLFMDCCRTDMPEVPVAPIATPVVKGGRPNEVKVFYAWATQWDTRAWEQPLGEPQEKRGVFTYALMEALTQGTPDAEGNVTTKGVYGHLEMRVSQLRNGDSSQAPQFHLQPLDTRIVLAQRSPTQTTTNLTITFDSALAGQQAQVQDGAFIPLHTRTVDDQPWPLALKAGAYVLNVAGKDRPILIKPNEVKTEHVPERVDA